MGHVDEFEVFGEEGAGVTQFRTPEIKLKPSNLLFLLLKWWAQQDLNLRPADYESDALTN